MLGKKLDQLADRGTLLWIAFVTVTIAVLIYLFDQSEFEEYRQRERSFAESFTEELRGNLELVLIEHELRARGLTTAFQLDRDFDQAQFSALAERFKQDNTAILNLAYLRGPIISLVYPFEENRSFVGRDLRDANGQYEVVKRIHETGTPEFQGPVMLLQGTQGIIVRMPVQPLGPGGGRAGEAGTVSVVLDAKRVLNTAIAATVDAEPVSRNYRIALSSVNDTRPATILGDASAFGADPVRKFLRLPGVRLQLAVAPKGNWGTGYQIPWAWNLGLFTIGLIAVMIITILRQQRRERRAAQAQLATAVDSLADGFVLFDDDDRLVLSNRRYAEIHDRCADAIRPGAMFEDILRLGIERGQFPEAVGNEEDWLARQLMKPGENGRDFEVGFSDGRWLRIIEKPTPAGGRVGLRIDITKQVETRRRAEVAEAQAKMAKEQLLAAVETLPDGFVLFDAEERLVLCNSKYKEIYSKSAQSMVPGATFEDILRFGLMNGQYYEAVGREEAWLAERLAAYRKVDGTIVEQRLDDGRWLRILDRMTPDGGRVGLRIDVTNQIESRDRAEMAERRLRDAINALPAGFCLFDSEGRLAMYNDFYTKLYEKSAPAVEIGARAEDILKKGLADGEYPEAIGREDEWLKKLSERTRSGEWEWEYPLQNGRWVRSYNQQTSDAGRVGIRVDITELKQHQAKLEASNAKLREALSERDAANKRFFDIAEISSDWFWEQDKELRFTFLSEGFDKYIGGNSEFLLGKTRAEVFNDIPEVMESADWKWLEAKQIARAPYRDFVYKAVGATIDGKWIRISGAPIFDENGEFSGYRGVGSDVSDLYNAMREAEAANKAKTEFLNIISHELRTPLTVVLGYNAFLAKPDFLTSIKKLQQRLDKGDLTAEELPQLLKAVKDEVSGCAGKMETSGKHLLKLINEMLDLARIDAGKMKIERNEVCVATVINSVVDQFCNTARQKSVELYKETHGETAFADETRMKQILINLVGNALKFTDSGHIRIFAESRGHEIVIHVEDSGCGIAEEKQKVIFDQFSQLDSSPTRERGGTGLGLTISRRLVEMQGGVITVESQEGKGSTFSFTLPAAHRNRTSIGDGKSTKAA